MHSLEAYIKATQACRSEKDLFKQFYLFLDSCGIEIHSYHIVAKNLRAIPLLLGIIRQNYPEAWSTRYVGQNYIKIDPIIEQSRRETRPFHWFDVGNMFNLSAQQKQFLEDLRDVGFTDGLAISVFGPGGTMAYFGLGTLGGKLALSETEMLVLQFACLQTHNRYLELADHEQSDPPKRLSPREGEVLSLVAKGLSNNKIANRLGISENTVDTMVRRVFRKLSVNNRLSAVLRGIGLGVILP